MSVKPRANLPQYRQNLLNGASSVKGANVVLYPQPRDAHQRFMNAFIQACDLTLTKEQCQQRGSKIWSKIKHDIDLQAQFIKKAPNERLALLQIPVEQHQVVNFFGPAVAPLANVPAEEKNVVEEKKEPDTCSNGTPLNAALLNFLRFIGVDAMLLIKSDMLLKPDFAQPLHQFAALIVRELDLSAGWQSKYMLRAAHAERGKPAPALERCVRDRDNNAIDVGKSLLELFRLKEEAANPTSRSIVAINFGSALTNFTPLLALLGQKCA